MTNFHHVHSATEFNLNTPDYGYTRWLYILSVSTILNFNWSAFLTGIFSTLKSHGQNNGTNGGCQLSGGDLRLLSMLCGLLIRHGPLCGRLLASWLLQGYPTSSFCCLPPYPAAHPTQPIH